MPNETLDSTLRERLLAAPRPRRLPLAPLAEPARRRLPLASEARHVDQRFRPIYAVWELTLACDLACRHCGSRAGRARPDELTTEECLRVVNEIAELGVREVTLIGGEAYLRPDCLEIIRAIVLTGMTVTMTSGGRGIDSERARQMADAGIAGVSISLDGLQTVHDRLRRVVGSFAAALRALENLRAWRVPVTVNSQINRLSMPDLEGLLDVITAAGAHSWQLSLTVPMGRAADEPEVLLQPFELLELFPRLTLLAARSRERGVRFFPANNVGYFGPFESQLRPYNRDCHAGSCTAGLLTLGIEADGTVKGCPSLSTAAWASGNLRDERLLDIWERGLPLRYTRDRSVSSLWGFCRTCYYADSCRAGCTWTSDVFFGRPGNNPYCHHRALAHAERGERERLVPVEAASGLPFDHGRFEIIVEPAPTRAEPMSNP